MIYINALNLINLCVKNKLLIEKDGKIFIYRNATLENEEGWYLDEKDFVAKELMNDEKSQRILIDALKKKNVNFIPKDYIGLFDATEEFNGNK